MQLLRTLVLSALLYASTTSATTIPGGVSAGEDVEITIKVHHGQPIADGAGVGVSER